MAAQPEILNVVASFWKETAYMDNSVFLCKLAEHTRLFSVWVHSHTHYPSHIHAHAHTPSVCFSHSLLHSLLFFLILLHPHKHTQTQFSVSLHTQTLSHTHTHVQAHTLAETNVFLICYLKVVPHNDEFLPWTELPLSPSRPYLYGHLEDFAFTWSWSWTGNLVEISGSIFSKLLSFNIKKRLSGWKKNLRFSFLHSLWFWQPGRRKSSLVVRKQTKV